MEKNATPVIALLGAPAIVENGESRTLRASEKTLALLVLLVCNVERPLSRAWLSSMLWPDVEEAEARTNLRRHFYLLAKSLPDARGDCVKLSRSTAQWDTASGYRCDVIEFLDAIEAGDYVRAIERYGGPLCLGNFEEAVLEERERLQQRYVGALQHGIDAARASGDRPKAIALLERLSSHDPLNEQWIRALAQARLDGGDRTGARRELVALTGRLRAELGVEPDEETAALLAVCLEKPAGGVTTNLPVESDSFIGREAAMDELHRALESHAWVTIAGPGGVGKTRLAIHAARAQLSEYPQGAWFVDLSASTTWPDAVRAIAATLGLSNDPHTALQNHLRTHRILLVLDNLEQLDDDCGAAIGGLLQNGASRILATSRKALGGASECVYRLAHLAVPDTATSPTQALTYAGVRLFVERAVAVAPSFALSHENAAHVISIVSRLDGLPLAIELVAARANLLTVEGIAKRLHDLDAFVHKQRSSRHQTVNAALRWSYDLLSAREKLLLQRLAIFAGPFDLAAIESICADDRDLPEAALFPVLSELVEASLVISRRTEHDAHQRYNMLETVRQYLRALPGNAAEALVDRYADYYAGFVDELAPYAEGAREDDYYRPIDEEYANVRAALDAAIQSNFPAAIRLVSGLYRYWAMRGRLREGWKDACACDDDERLPALAPEQRGRFYQALGIIARELGEHDSASKALERALECFRACNNERRECDVLWAQAKLAYNSGQERFAIDLFRRCSDLMQRFGDEHGRASAIANIGSLSHNSRDFEEADRMYAFALQEYQRLGYLRGLAFIYRQFSLLRQDQGRYDEAIDFAKHSVAISVEIGELDREADAYSIWAGALNDARREREAFAPLLRALEILERSENALFFMLAVQALANSAHLAGEHVDSVRLNAFTDAMRRRKSLGISEKYAADIGRDVDDLKQRLPKELYSAAWTAGEAMSAAGVISLAQRLAARYAPSEGASSGEDVSRTIASL